MKFFAWSVKIWHSDRNDFARCFDFRWVCEIGSQGVRNFVPHAKIFIDFACPMKILQGVRIVLIAPLFEIPPAIDHQKPKLNQTKIKLKQEIIIKTSNNIGKLLNQK